MRSGLSFFVAVQVYIQYELPHVNEKAYISNIILCSENLPSNVTILFESKGAQAGNAEAAHAHIITPSAPEERGAQLSIKFSIPITKVSKELQKRGVAVSRLCIHSFLD